MKYQARKSLTIYWWKVTQKGKIKTEILKNKEKNSFTSPESRSLVEPALDEIRPIHRSHLLLLDSYAKEKKHWAVSFFLDWCFLHVVGFALVTTGLWLVLTCIFLTVNTSQGKYMYLMLLSVFVVFQPFRYNSCIAFFNVEEPVC